jgi:hemoglobin
MPIDKLACFLSGWMGGPRRFDEKYGDIHIPKFHANFTIAEGEGEAWLLCMGLALDEQDYAQDFKVYLKEQFKVPVQRIIAMNEYG